MKTRGGMQMERFFRCLLHVSAAFTSTDASERVSRGSAQHNTIVQHEIATCSFARVVFFLASGVGHGYHCLLVDLLSVSTDRAVFD